MNSKPNVSFVVREATPSDRGEIETLIAEMIPGCDVASRWRWLYESNPGGPAITWLAIAASGEVAGCTSFFPFRLRLDDREVRGALGGDGYVRPAFRRKGVGALLHDASRRAMPTHDIACMYGAPGAMNVTPLKHGGSRETGTVVRWARPLRGSALPVPAWLHSPLSRLLGVQSRAHLDKATTNDPRIDSVWHATRNHLRLTAVRDAAFYTWRFDEAPAQRQTSYVILDNNRPIGACALEPLRDGRTLRIVDLLATPEAWHACLRAIIALGTDTEAEILDLKLLEHDGRTRQMWRSLFVERDRKPFLCMIPTDGDDRFIDPARWFYTQADSDLDDHS